MKKIVYLLFIGLMFPMLEYGTAVATIETPEPASSLNITVPIVTPNNQPAYLWMNSFKSEKV